MSELRELSLADFGLETIPIAAARKKWSVKTLQNWVNTGRLPAVVLGAGRGRGGTFLVRIADVDKMAPPERGRPPKELPPAKKPARKRKEKGT